MRRYVPCFALLVALGACGSSGPGKLLIEPEPEIARSKALALVRAGTLREADLPGHKATRAKPEPDDPEFDAAMEECLGRAERPYAAEDPGYDFRKGSLTITSSVDVAMTKTQAEDDLADIKNVGVYDCVEEEFRKAVADLPGVTLTFDSKHVHVSVPFADDAFGLVMIITVRGPKGSITNTTSVVGALVGNAEIGIMASGEGRVPPPNELTGLLGKAVARARKVA